MNSHGFIEATANRRQITFKFIDERYADCVFAMMWMTAPGCRRLPACDGCTSIQSFIVFPSRLQPSPLMMQRGANAIGSSNLSLCDENDPGAVHRGRTKDEWKICAQKRCGRPPKVGSAVAASTKVEMDSSEGNSSEEDSSDRDSSAGDSSAVSGGKGANNANVSRGEATGAGGAAKGNNATKAGAPNRWAAKGKGGAASGAGNTTARKPSWGGKAKNGSTASSNGNKWNNNSKSGNRTSSGSGNANKWNKGQTYSWKVLAADALVLST